MMCCLRSLSGRQKAEWLLRWAIGVFLLMAGIGKLAGGVSMFVAKMTPGFEDTFLPIVLVTGFFYIVPFLEVLLGICLLIGWRRECTLWVTGVLLIIFIFGLMLKGDTGSISALFAYLLTIAGALALPAAWDLGCCSGGDCSKGDDCCRK